MMLVSIQVNYQKYYTSIGYGPYDYVLQYVSVKNKKRYYTGNKVKRI